MADTLNFTPRAVDPREALIRKLQEAPLDHASALLDAYAILELMQKKGLLELAKTSLGAGEGLVELAAEILEKEGVVALSRNLSILVKVLGGMNPKVLEAIQRSLVASTEVNRVRQRLGFFSVLGSLFRPSFWNGLGALSRMLAALGSALPQGQASAELKLREKVYRHEVKE